MRKSVFCVLLLIVALCVLFNVSVAQAGFKPKIVFTSDRTGNFDIWMMDPDGTNLTQLTANPEREVEPMISPDGTKILYETGPSGGFTELWVMNIDGTGQKRITSSICDTNICRHAFWSYDGSQIFYVKIGPPHSTWVMDWSYETGGTNDVEIPYITGGNKIAPGPYGEKLVFGLFFGGDNGYDVGIANLDLSNPNLENLSASLYMTGFEAPSYHDVWGMNQKILLTAQEPSFVCGTCYSLYLIDYVNYFYYRLTYESNASDNRAGWSPDETAIVFDSIRSGNRDIWRADFDNQTNTLSNFMQLTDEPGDDIEAHWGMIMVSHEPCLLKLEELLAAINALEDDRFQKSTYEKGPYKQSQCHC